MFFLLAPGPLSPPQVLVVLSTTEAESVRRLCWKSCKTCRRNVVSKPGRLFMHKL